MKENTGLLNLWGWGRGFLFHRRTKAAAILDLVQEERLLVRVPVGVHIVDLGKREAPPTLPPI